MCASRSRRSRLRRAALGGLPAQPLRDALLCLGLAHHLVPVGQQAVQAQLGGLRAQLGCVQRRLHVGQCRPSSRGWAGLHDPVVRGQFVRAHRRVAPRDVLRAAPAPPAAAGPLPRAARSSARRTALGCGTSRCSASTMAACSAAGAIAVEQAQQCRGDGAQVVAARGGRCSSSVAAGAAWRQPIGAAVGAGRALVLDQRLDVGGLLDLLAAVVAARMRGQLLRCRRGCARADRRPARPACAARGCAAPSSRSDRSARRASCPPSTASALAQRELALGQGQQAGAARPRRPRARSEPAVLRASADRTPGPRTTARLGVQIVEIGERRERRRRLSRI